MTLSVLIYAMMVVMLIALVGALLFQGDQGTDPQPQRDAAGSAAGRHRGRAQHRLECPLKVNGSPRRAGIRARSASSRARARTLPRSCGG